MWGCRSVKTAIAWVGGILVAGVVAWGAFHLFIPTINSQQTSPSGHPQGSCWACHMVSANAKIIESE